MAKARGRGREDELLLSPRDGARVRQARAGVARPSVVPTAGEVTTLMRQMGWQTSNSVAADIARSFAAERSTETGARTTTTLGGGSIRPVANPPGTGGAGHRGKGKRR